MSKEEACGGELDQARPEVPGLSVGFVRLDVADAAIHIRELALNEEVGLHRALTNRSLRLNPEPFTHGPERDLGRPDLAHFDAVEKRFLGDLCATLIQNEGRKRKLDSKKSTPMIRLLRSSRMPPTFLTASTHKRHPRDGGLILPDTHRLE
jgi:hypothetical protein